MARISIVIVNYNTVALLEQCLQSIYAGAEGLSLDVWLVDNSSQDESVAMVRSLFPQVRVIANRSNVGFSRANNLALAQCRSEYVLLLNPDTVVLGDALRRMVRFLDRHPRVGIAGGRVLNGDGTLQLACRRSIPTPAVAFFRLTGLSRLFPKSRRMARYNVTYQDPARTCAVDAVSGAFLMIRRRTMQDIGLLDERFFMYGEDLDWCLRAKQAGWRVMYYPRATIIHYKGRAVRHNSHRATRAFYHSMWLFHRKHFAESCSAITNLLVYAGILGLGILSWRRWLFPVRGHPTRIVPGDGEASLGLCRDASLRERVSLDGAHRPRPVGLWAQRG